MKDTARPFAFEDLPLNSDGQRIEPESWGPTYDIKRQRGKTIGEVVRAKQLAELHSLASAGKCHVNIKADLKYNYTSAKARAAMRTAFHAQAAADRRAWAADTSKEKFAAYDAAPKWKPRVSAPARKPHYVLREGAWRLAA